METALLIVIGVLLFALIIFSHEMGHFLLAKWSGVRVNEFSLGMGPRLLHFTKGETEYSLRLFPIGGYCAMEGEDEESDDPKAFNHAKVYKRILIVAAGAIMNVLLGVILMACLLGTQERFATTTVSQFTENSFLEQAGAQPGDVIVNINGYEVYTDKDLSFALAMADPTDTRVTVQRDGGANGTIAHRLYRRYRRRTGAAGFLRAAAGKERRHVDCQIVFRYHFGGAYGMDEPVWSCHRAIFHE